MKKNSVILIIIFVCLTTLTVGGVLFWRSVALIQTVDDITIYVQPQGKDSLNATYRIEGEYITLQDGVSEKSIQDSSAKIRTTVFGNPVVGDMNDDGLDDFAVMLVHDPWGSGTFYYTAVAVRMEDGTYKGTNAILLGDRIAPQNILIKNGVLMANYAGRKDTEPMTAMPSVGITTYITFADGILHAFEKDTEGEVVVEGDVVVSEKETTLRTCDGQIYKLDIDESLLLAIRNVQDGRSVDTKSPVFAVVSGIMSGTKDPVSIAVLSILKTPVYGGCRSEVIVVNRPYLDEEIVSPISFSGRARGTWFFEGSFPVVLVDWDGLIIAEGVATAETEWMTEEFVPFRGILEFEKPSYGKRGAMIFKKDNPSGDSFRDDALEFSITFE